MLSNKKLLKKMKSDFHTYSENTDVPENLEKDNIIDFLNRESAVLKKTDKVSSSQENRRKMVRKIHSIAASLVAVVGVALLANHITSRVVIGDRIEFRGYNSSTPIKSVETVDEIKEAIQKISSDETDNKDNEENKGNNIIRDLREKYENGRKKSGKYVQDYSPVTEYSVTKKIEWIQHADVVKSDKNYLYILSSGTDKKTDRKTQEIKIVDIKDPTDMKVVSTISLYDSNSAELTAECDELYLKNNTLIVILEKYNYDLNDNSAEDTVTTIARFYDVSDRTKPVKAHEHTQEGTYISSVLYGSKLLIFTEDTVSIDDDSPVPSLIVDGIKSYFASKDIFISVNSPTDTYLIATLSDIYNYDIDVAKMAILGSGRDISCISGSIFVSRRFKSVDSEASKSEIYRFDYNGTDIYLKGSYVVDGLVFGPLSSSESGDYLRFFTNDKGVINAYILNGNLKPISSRKDVTDGKTAKEARFVGDSGYITTDSDEIIVDFSNVKTLREGEKPSNDKVQLATYSLSKKYIIRVERDTSKKIYVSLVDVSQRTAEKIISTYTLKDCPVSSSVSDIRSIIVSDDSKLLGLPIVKANPSGNNTLSSYILFKLSEDGIKAVGTYKHSDNGNKSDANRGVINGDKLYTISGDKVSAFSIWDSVILGSVDISK